MGNCIAKEEKRRKHGLIEPPKIATYHDTKRDLKMEESQWRKRLLEAQKGWNPESWSGWSSAEEFPFGGLVTWVEGYYKVLQVSTEWRRGLLEGGSWSGGGGS